jgi:DNA gyrase/topoisomerase IV subunit A
MRMRQDHLVTLDAEQRDAVTDQLRNIELWLGVIDGRRMIASLVGAAESEPDAVASVVDALSCDASQADQILSLQLSRFTEASRNRLVDERRQLLAELQGVEETVAPSDRSTPASRSLRAAARAATESPPTESLALSADDRAERRRGGADDHLHMLGALAQVAQNPTPVLELVYESTDNAAAAATLSTQFGWSEVQVAAVLGMQLRVLSARSRRELETELQKRV